jgi:2-polyprenyl-3-methyl-5-hydroxy-6-metoxy-1,4-benzoquinol methylase
MEYCPCCSAKITTKTLVSNGYFSYKCEMCLHEFFKLDNLNNLNITSDLYKNDSDYKGDLEKSKDYKYLIQWNHLKALNFLNNFRNINVLLDIGTFNGFFVKFLREKGYNAFGTDFNEDAINNGIKNYDLKGFLSINIDDFGLNNFSCISAFEVIEHLEDPNLFLKKIHSLLDENGLIIISCPNNKMLWRVQVDYPPHHLSRFSPHSLNMILEKNGFEIICHYEQMSSIDLIRNYIGSLLRDNTKSLKGGSHRKLFFIDPLRLILNKGRRFTYFIAKPIDAILYFLGYRYVCQMIVAQKKSI